MKWVQLCGSLSSFLALPFFGIEMKTDLFQFCGHLWVFQICWHIACSTLTASSIRILNSWAEIPSLPLSLLIVLLPKAHLTSHSRMSDSRWLITHSWLSRSVITGALGWPRGRDSMGREVGEGFRMGNTCTPVVDSCQCIAKPVQYCKVISLQLK